MNRNAAIGDVLSGELGLVVTLTPADEERCRSLARELLPPSSEYILGAENVPHITLYQAALKDVPVAKAVTLVGELSLTLKGKPVLLKELVSFGSRFLFWNVDQQGPSSQLLKDCHEAALELASFVDREENARLLPLRPGTGKVIEYFARYGYGLVHELYLPHVTLGVNTRIDSECGLFSPHSQPMEIRGVSLTRMGQYGKVVETLA